MYCAGAIERMWLSSFSICTMSMLVLRFLCQVLTDSADGRKYWNKLKQRLKEEGNESVTNCHQLKMKSHKDGKMYKTDAASTKQLLHIIQSIPFKKAEPFKM